MFPLPLAIYRYFIVPGRLRGERRIHGCSRIVRSWLRFSVYPQLAPSGSPMKRLSVFKFCYYTLKNLTVSLVGCVKYCYCLSMLPKIKNPTKLVWISCIETDAVLE